MDCTPIFKKALKASHILSGTDVDSINRALLILAVEVEEQAPSIIAANKLDLSLKEKSDPVYDRLQLTLQRIKCIASDIRNVAGMPSPAGRILSDYKKANGLSIKRVSVPFGVIGIIYEARPNVTIDVFSLCFKSNNVCVLKGGSDAINTNRTIVRIIKDVLQKCDMSQDFINLLPPGRTETTQLLNARGFIDLVIPRGSQALIEYVRKNAAVPIIETGAGICHTYFDEYGDKEKGRAIINNAKTRRVSVCNALDCLVIHRERLKDLAYIVGLCADSNVEIFADVQAYSALSGKYPSELLKKATPASFGTEFLSFKMAVKTVSSIDEALDHIEEFSSKHSEAIISEDNERLEKFCTHVDASAVYTNTSTAFTDGAEFGLGSEIGISTQKLHARGPMALEALTTYKWVVRGDGQIRV